MDVTLPIHKPARGCCVLVAVQTRQIVASQWIAAWRIGWGKEHNLAGGRYDV
jgi:hypothetical protein